MRTYAIGDIHGHLDLLQAAHALIAADRAAIGDAEAPVVHVGDLVDRGPDSRGVIEFLMQGQSLGAPWVVLKGNHDRLFTLFMADPGDRDPRLRADLAWLHPRLGGGATLSSYGMHAPSDRPLARVHAEALEAVPAAHVDYLRSLPTWFLRDDVLFVHAGVRPGVDLREQTEDDLLWIRHEFLEDTRDHGALIVHGHTALPEARHYGNRLNLDSSAAYGGPLTAVVIEGREVWHLTEAGRARLDPPQQAAAAE
ncbi:metallophosphoesterase family protein [Frigidibacter mobilis]|uniref:Metallophosphoesterase n=1 Tax=Frigidibacter mobilis TaxID=1335048 RepID=A0A165SEX5_9RHOB|nr:metallophosphoesterase family protein [Frigidibacter mobilis]AMY67383.1 metallophosphoesterase [Frigidibacter mobilis]